MTHDQLNVVKKRADYQGIGYNVVSGQCVDTGKMEYQISFDIKGYVNYFWTLPDAMEFLYKQNAKQRSVKKI